MISAAAAESASSRTLSKSSAQPAWRWLLLFIPILLGAFFTDQAAAAWVRIHSTPELRSVAGAISKIGDWPILAAVGMFFLILARCRGDRRVARLVSIMLIASVLAGLAANIVRGLSGRGRPRAPIEMQGWHGPHDGKQWLVGKSKRNSFPSAHTATATAFFAPLCLGFARRAGVVKLGIALAIVAPVLIAASRIALNAHFLSDVVAGALVGLGAVWLALKWRPIRHTRRWMSLRMAKLAAGLCRSGKRRAFSRC
jgi:membrane-associated phospholipid phosphatase